MYGEEPFGPGCVITHSLHPMLCSPETQEAEPEAAEDVKCEQENSSPSWA